mgnify:CR=1 FL=1
MKQGDIVRHRTYNTLNLILDLRDNGLVKVYCIEEQMKYVTVGSAFEAIEADK